MASAPAAAHPAFAADEVAKHMQASIRRVTDFLDRNTPLSGGRRAA